MCSDFQICQTDKILFNNTTLRTNIVNIIGHLRWPSLRARVESLDNRENTQDHVNDLRIQRFYRSRKQQLPEWYLSSYPSRTGGRKRLWSQLNNLKWQGIDHMCQWGANRNPWTGYRMGSSRPPISPVNPQTGGPKAPPSKF